MSSDAFLDASAAIGRRIVAEAIWDDGRCSWVGAAAEPAKRSRPEYRPVGPLLYDGTAGIALFLAQLFAVTAEASLRRTALGALRHSVGRAAVLPPADGLYGGTPGIAWAAVHAAALLDCEEVIAGARSLVDHPAGASRRDLRTGAAGTLVALLGLASALDEPQLLSAANELGETLLADASVRAGRWSWADPARPRARHATGMLDGAAGIGAALLELAHATGDTRFLAAASGASASATAAQVGVRHPTWCSGTARVKPAREGPRPDTSVHDVLTLELRYAIDDLSLCHGTAGLAFALLAAGETELPAALGRVAVDRYAPSGDWPCGVFGTTPGLFRGLSGIGWLLLALHDPRTASPLALPCAVDSSRGLRIRSGPVL